MAWQAKIILKNFILYNMDIIHNGNKIATVPEMSEYTFFSEIQNNEMFLKFWTEPNVYFLETIFNFTEGGPGYINRGILQGQTEDIKLTLISNSEIIFEQTNDTGGMNFLSDLFANGNAVTLEYTRVTVALEQNLTLDS